MKVDNVPLDEAYFEWLYFKVVSRHEYHPSDTYRNFLKQLYTTPFYILVDRDENRAEDGAALREVFTNDKGLASVDDEAWFEMDCSIFEMIYALAERMSFEADRSPKNCFWELLNNLGVGGFNDAWYDSWVSLRVDTLLHIFIERLYEYDGSGGLFPLRHPSHDQTTVEIWYQMAAYLEENSSLY